MKSATTYSQIFLSWVFRSVVSQQTSWKAMGSTQFFRKLGVVYFMIYMDVSKNSGTPKWMVYDGKPYEIGWFGGTTIFGNAHMGLVHPKWGKIGDPNGLNDLESRQKIVWHCGPWTYGIPQKPSFLPVALNKWTAAETRKKRLRKDVKIGF